MDSSTDLHDDDAHGGNLAAAVRRFGPAPAPGWLDLSTGINPFPYPHIGFDPSALTRLPDAAARDRLLAAARRYYRVPDGAGIVAAAGTQHIIQVLPHILAGNKIFIADPTYSEHELSWRRAGRTIMAAGPADITVIVTPNNPDGRVVGELPDAGIVIVDEAFGDVAPATSSVARAADGKILVLKSFGKFFGLAGLRLGFCIGSPSFIEALSRELGPWAVSGPALEIGERALSDEAWIAAMRDNLANARWDLERILTAAGLQIVGGTDLFCLTDSPVAQSIFGHLGRAGILVRAFADHPTWLRFGLPGSKANLARLETALADHARSSR
jgi:cobalamin biosynthetic protein CobC